MIKKIFIFSIILVGFLIILVAGGVIFSSRVLNIIPYLVSTPKVIPPGYTREDTIQSERDNLGRFYIFTYKHPEKENFTYHLRLKSSDVRVCSPQKATSSVIADYSEFNLKDFDGCCAMTLTEADGSKKRVYQWYKDDTQFYIFTSDASINDSEVLDMMRSLKTELVFIGSYIDH